MNIKINIVKKEEPMIGDIALILSVFDQTPIFGSMIKINKNTEEVTISFERGYHVDTFKIQDVYFLNQKYL